MKRYLHNLKYQDYLICTLSLFTISIISLYCPQESYEFKPNTHILTGNVAIESILSGQDSVIINDKTYPINPHISEAIRLFPDYYRGGVVGPDGFPDIYVGQSFIHPDSRCNNGELNNNDCSQDQGKSFTYEWLRHIYDQAWLYYNSHNGDNEGKKALAFMYGFLTHAAGDMWGHTLVNDFARGIFPGVGEISSDPSKLGIVARHIVPESYIGKHTPETTLTLNAPLDFVYYTFLENEVAAELGRGAIIDYFFGLKERLDKKEDDLQEEIDDCEWYEVCTTIVLKIQKKYITEWKKDVERGLKYWPKLSLDISRALYTNNDVNGAIDVIQDFMIKKNGGLLSMMGSPDFVLEVVSQLSKLTDLMERMLGPVAEPLERVKEERDKFIKIMIEQSTGIDVDKMKEYYTHPENYISNSEIGYNSDTKNRIDMLMDIHNDPNTYLKFDTNSFAPFKNTVVLAKMILLSPETLNRLANEHNAPSIYPENENGVGNKNIMLDFIRSLDANHQWRLSSLLEDDVRPADGMPRQHGEGMPYWLSCFSRENIFRTLFVDWENNNFPDLGENCKPDKIITIKIHDYVINYSSTAIPSDLSLILKVGDQSNIEKIDNVFFNRVVESNLPEMKVFSYDNLKTSITLYHQMLHFPLVTTSGIINSSENFSNGIHTFEKIFDAGSLSVDINGYIKINYEVNIQNYKGQIIANAGENQTAAESSVVRVDGNKSYSLDDIDTFNFNWKQVSPSSPILTITNKTTEMPSIYIPYIPNGRNNETTFIIELTITDSKNRHASDIVAINVKSPIDIWGYDYFGGNYKNIQYNGSEGSDFMAGFAGNDILHGNGSNDVLIGGLGNDEIHGDNGNDIIKGNAGNDKLFGGNDSDYISGGEGKDLMIGGTGSDHFECGEGNDRINDYNDTEKDTIEEDCENVYTSLGIKLDNNNITTIDIPGNNSKNFLNGTDIRNFIRGFHSGDILWGFAGDDVLLGDGGNDTIVGMKGNDIVKGGTGNDLLYGDEGNDYISGGQGDDLLYGNIGSDHFECGEGNDSILNYNENEGDTIEDDCEWFE